VHDVALRLDALVSLAPGATPGDVERAVARHGFSRYSILGDDGEPVGYVHLKDVIDLDEDEFDDPIPAKRVRRLVSIFDGTDLEDALATMRRLGTHVARAFDEDGRTTGVIFLEDIIEELVGEVQDATRRG
jgi:CBS domain containing-hemolysin-like protein